MGKSTRFAIEPDANATKSRVPAAGSQRERFMAAARELGADESEEAFDRALRKVGSAPPAPAHKADKNKSGERANPAKPTRRR